MLQRLVAKGHDLTLFTMRGTGPKTDYLTPAVKWFEENTITLNGVNSTPGQGQWTNSPKAYGQLIIDDTSLGIPTRKDSRGAMCVDWVAVEKLLEDEGIL